MNLIQTAPLFKKRSWLKGLTNDRHWCLSILQVVKELHSGELETYSEMMQTEIDSYFRDRPKVHRINE